MPTLDDLGKLASQLYKGNPSIGAKQNVYSGLQWDQDAATSLGFTSSFFSFWAGEEDSGRDAYRRLFNTTSSYWHYGDRGSIGDQAVCIAD